MFFQKDGLKCDLQYRSSQQKCSIIKSVLRNFAKFTGEHLCQSLIFNKVAGLITWHKYIPVNFAKFLRRPFLQSTSERLLLAMLKLSLKPRL